MFETDDDTQFHETKVLKFPHVIYGWLATLKLGMKQGILEGQTRPQRQGHFEYSFNYLAWKVLGHGKGFETPNH